jgi:hypothetical protein
MRTKMAGFKKGFGAVDEAVKNASRKSSGPRSNNIGWKDGEKKVLRFLDDEPLTIGFHEFTPCKDGKSRDFVCAAQLPEPRPCWICSNVQKKGFNGVMGPCRPRTVSVGYAALREEKRDGRKFSYSDITHDVEGVSDEILKELKGTSAVVEGSTVKNVPTVGVIKQAVGNFWDNVAAYYVRYGTTTDRDYEITRHGNDKNTKYVPIPCDVVDDLKTQEDVDDHYALAKLLHPTIAEWVERMGSTAYYDYHLVTGAVEKDDSSAKKDDSEEEGESTGFSGAESLAEKLRSYSKNK